MEKVLCTVSGDQGKDKTHEIFLEKMESGILYSRGGICGAFWVSGAFFTKHFVYIIDKR